jgi:uncharacterized cupredoxin-like copper-binding protein
LVSKCVQCHDLHTTRAQPRTPDEWRRTVARTASRSSVVNLIDEAEQLRVTAYLVAISPTLQQTARLRRDQQMETSRAQTSLATATQAVQEADSEASPVNLAVAKEIFETRCSQCYSPVLVEAKPPLDQDAVVSLVSWMVRNGLRVTDQELEQIIAYLVATFVKSGAGASAAPSPSSAPVASASGAAVEQEITLRPDGTTLNFETPELAARAGVTIRLTLDNPTDSGQAHNFVLARDDAAYDDVSNVVLGVPDSGFAPQYPQVIASIPVLPAGTSASVEFKAPDSERYKFSCMMPGHSFTMHGNLLVK